MLVSLFQLSFLGMLCGIGMLPMRFTRLTPTHKLFTSFLIGSLVVIGYCFILIETMQLYLRWIYPLLAFGTLALFINIKIIIAGLSEIARFINEYLFQHDKWRWYFIVIFALLLVWLWMMSLTPPRAADAMAYHLAQPKQIIMDHGFHFYPYINYHYPLNFALIVMPSMLLFSGVGYKVMVFFYFLIALLFVLKIAQIYEIKLPRVFFLFLFFIPITFHEAHSALNDWPVITYAMMAFYFAFLCQKNTEVKWLYFSMASIAIALGVKYQAVLYCPWLLILLVYPFFLWKKKSFFIHFLLAGLLGMFLASPFYYKNWLYFQNPFWPLALHFFHSKPSYLTDLTKIFVVNNSGQHGLHSIYQNAFNFLFYPLIPATIWGLLFFSLLDSWKKQVGMILGLITFLLFWWSIQPVYYLRFMIYALPLVALMVFKGIVFAGNEKPIWIRYANLSAIGLTFLFGVSIFAYYSLFYFDYYIYKDKAAYHRYTLYYPALQWINKNTPKNSKILALLVSGQTYYLDRCYIRSDALAATTDWLKIRHLSALESWIKKNHITYVLKGYDATPLLDRYLHSTYVHIVYSKKEKLYFSRFLSHYQYVQVIVGKVV